MKRKILCWFPVALLALCNILVSVFVHQPLQVSLAYIIGALAEELFFRFLLLKTILLPRIKPTLAIVIVSVIFAGMHLFNLRAGQPTDLTLLQMGCAFAFGMWAGAVTWKSTWLIPLFAHVLLNLTTVDGGGCIILAVTVVVLVDGILLMKEDIFA